MNTRRPPLTLTSILSMTLRMVSISPLRAWTISAFERRSGTISGGRSEPPTDPPPPAPAPRRAGATGGGSAPAGRGADPAAAGPGPGAEATGLEELVEDGRHLARLGVLQRDDLQLVERHLDVDQLDDVEQAG